MSIETTFNYDIATDYDFDTNLIEIVNGQAQLKLLGNPSQDFVIDFSSDAGFTYDNTKIEFVGGEARQKLFPITETFSQDFSSDVGFTYDGTKSEFSSGLLRQKDVTPVNSLLGYKADSFDLNWAKNGTTTGVQIGSPTISGGKLVCNTGLNTGVYWDGCGVSQATNKVSIKLKYTPNYTGAPAGNRGIAEIHNGTNNNNKIVIMHGATGAIRITCYTSTGASVFVATPIGGYSAVSGVEKEIMFTLDTDIGTARTFIGGLLIGTITASAFTRTNSANRLQIGAGVTYSNANGSFDDVMVFNDIQETATYIPGYSVSTYLYSETTTILPEQSYTYLVDTLGVPTIVSSNDPHFVINDYYWNGSVWDVSSDTYATSMTEAEWISNIATFPSAQLGTGIIIKAIFQDSNTRSSIDNITFSISENDYASTVVTTPELEHVGAGAIVSFDEFNITGSSTLRYSIQIGRSGNYLWYDGADWSISNNTFAEANDYTTFNDNLGTLPIEGEIYGQFKIYYPESNSQGSIDNLEAILTTQTYSTATPHITPKTSIITEQLNNFNASILNGNLDTIRFTILLNEVEMWWDGSDWSVSSGYAESNTALEISDNSSTLIATYGNIFPKAYLYSDNGSTTPALKSITLLYDFYAITSEPRICIVWGYLKNSIGVPLVNAAISISLISNTHYSGSGISTTPNTITTNSEGYWEIGLIETENMIPNTSQYLFEFKALGYSISQRRAIPNITSINYYDLA